ncbi:ABC transporter permease [Paenibacillus sp. SN-8-1]|uniref:ABC transporter permease n=1 Tax=Paenibacillus sp. SN-8-1 TaxID=3435409 RepID=UPI003D9AB2EA
MGNFLSLVQNENMKIYRRLRTWIMLALVVLLPILFASIIAINENRFGPHTEAWSAASNLSFIYFLVSIFSVVIAADIVASEFTWGTIKLLLIRPWTRSKVLLSKLLAVLLFAIGISILFMIVTIAISQILFSSGPTATNMEQSNFGHFSLMIFYKFVDLLVISIFAFMISTVFRTSGLAIGLSMFLLLAGGILGAILNPVKYAWAKYLIFNNMDLSQYDMWASAGITAPSGMSLGFSATVLAVYVVIFLVIAWLVFKRRDVAA